MTIAAAITFNPGALLVGILAFAFILSWQTPIPVFALAWVSAPVAYAPPLLGLLSRMYPGAALAGLMTVAGLMRAETWRFVRTNHQVRVVMWPFWLALAISGFSAVLALLLPDPGIRYYFPVSGVGVQVTTLTQIVLLFMTATLPFVAAAALRSETQVIRLAFSLIGVGVLVSVLAMIGLRAGLVSSQQLAGVARPYAGALNGGPLGLVLSAVVPVALAYFLSPRFRRYRALLGIALLVIGVGTVLSFSRITWIAISVEVVIATLILSRTLAIAVLMAISCCALVLALSTFAPLQPLINFYDPNQVYGLERLRIWGDGWTIYLTHPWFGVGAGNFQFFDDSLNVQVPGAGVSHNQFLTVLAESGPVALLLIVVFLWRLLRLTISCLAANDDLLKIHSAAAMAATAAMMINGLAGDTFVVSAAASGGTFLYSLMTYYWLLIAMLFALSWRSNPEGVSKPFGLRPATAQASSI